MLGFVISFNGFSSSTVFFLTNKAGAAASVAAISGSGQSAPVNSAFAKPLVVKVTDQYGNAVTGVNVKFGAPAKNASGSFSNGTTPITGMTGADRPAVGDVHRQHRGRRLQRHGLGGRRQHPGFLQPDQ